MKLFKKIFIPSGQTKELDGLRSWTVKWDSYRAGTVYPYYASQNEVFLSRQDAEEFKNALIKAFKFTKSYPTTIEITENTQ